MTAPDDDEDDAALFRDAVGPVRKLREQAPPPMAERPRPRARMAERDEAAARDEFRLALDEQLAQAGDVLAWRQDSVPDTVYRRLRRGEISAQEELDLHGADARTAEVLLRAFLADALRHGLGCVRIIHGKGGRGIADFGSSGAPVLKNLVDRMLRQRASVLAFHSAPPPKGGTGAVVVLLAPSKRR